MNNTGQQTLDSQNGGTTPNMIELRKETRRAFVRAWTTFVEARSSLGDECVTPIHCPGVCDKPSWATQLSISDIEETFLILFEGISRYVSEKYENASTLTQLTGIRESCTQLTVLFHCLGGDHLYEAPLVGKERVFSSLGRPSLRKIEVFDHLLLLIANSRSEEREEADHSPEALAQTRALRLQFRTLYNDISRH